MYIPVLLLAILYSIIVIKLKTQAHPGEQSVNTQQQRDRRKRNVLQMSIAIVTVFVLCWLPNVTNYLITRTAEGEGLVGPRPHHFFAPPLPLFALKRKIIKIKKNTWNKFFSVYIPLHSLYFLLFQTPGILWGSCAFRGNCALGPTCPLIIRHALACLGHPFASFGSVCCTSSSGRVFYQFYQTKWRKLLAFSSQTKVSSCFELIKVLYFVFLLSNRWQEELHYLNSERP